VKKVNPMKILIRAGTNVGNAKKSFRKVDIGPKKVKLQM
jgi:hypothetical protein